MRRWRRSLRTDSRNQHNPAKSVAVGLQHTKTGSAALATPLRIAGTDDTTMKGNHKSVGSLTARSNGPSTRDAPTSAAERER